jgi:hypothetical protein
MKEQLGVEEGICGSIYREGRRRSTWHKFGTNWRQDGQRNNGQDISALRRKESLAEMRRYKDLDGQGFGEEISIMDAEVGIGRMSGCNNTVQRQRTGVCE